MASHHPPYGSGAPNKVPIPRLFRPHNGFDDRADDQTKRRVPTACDNCRTRKIKCTGDQPRCASCQTLGLECNYLSTRKDRFRLSTEHQIRLIQLLDDLKDRVNDEDEERIEDLLAAVTPAAAAAASIFHIPWSGSTRHGKAKSGRSSTSDHGEADVCASVGSNEDADLLEEDLHRSNDARATGFMGRGSVVQWLKSLHQDLADHDSTTPDPSKKRYGPPGLSDNASDRRLAASHARISEGLSGETAKDSTFYLDNQFIGIDWGVDPFALPSLEVTNHLIACYMRTLQDAFPIIGQYQFQYEVHNHFLAPTTVSNTWLATLNLVLALGAKYAYLEGAGWATESDHSIYHSRAHMLGGLPSTPVIDKPELSLIHNSGLLALYLLVIGQLNKAWITIGTCIRYGQSLGLHVRNEDGNASELKKEMMVRTWWSLYSLESVLTVATSRPSIIVAKFCSTPLPLPLSEDQLTEEIVSTTVSEHSRNRLHLGPLATNTLAATSKARESGGERQVQQLESYIQARISIGTITQDVLESFYSAGTSTFSWEDVQRSMSSVIELLDDWLKALPPGLSFDPSSLDREPNSHQLNLMFLYFSAKMIALRPCLCKVDQRIERQGEASVNFDQETARSCVEAAKGLTDVLSNERDDAKLYINGPAWCLINYIMQAMTVFFTEMTYGCMHMPGKEKDLAHYVKKLIRRLRDLAQKNDVAKLAYKIGLDVFKPVALKYKIDIDDLLHEPAYFINAPYPGTGDHDNYEPNMDTSGFPPQGPDLGSGYPTGSGPSDLMLQDMYTQQPCMDLFYQNPVSMLPISEQTIPDPDIFYQDVDAIMPQQQYQQ